jgi:hypothetical protein
MNNMTEFFYALGFTLGEIGREDIQKYLKERGVSETEINEFKKWGRRIADKGTKEKPIAPR